MTTWRRRLADSVTALFGIQFARVGYAWSMVELEQLRRFMNVFEIDCVFDVGANIGQYAQRLRSVGFTGLIISFEPNPEAAATARLVSAKDARWIIKDYVLDSTSGMVEFNIMSGNEFSSLRKPDHSGTQSFIHDNRIVRTLKLEARTLAQIFPVMKAEFGFHRPFLKMDTQGHDTHVVTGAGPFIRDFVGLQSELSMTPLYVGAHRYNEALDYYNSLGFKLSGLAPNNAGAFPDLYEVDCIMYNSAFRPSSMPRPGG